MKATAVSRIVKTIGIGMAESAGKILRDLRVFPSRTIKRCPAIMLAVNRTHRVIGRIIFLVISINTINIMRALGVPCGTK